MSTTAPTLLATTGLFCGWAPGQEDEDGDLAAVVAGRSLLRDQVGATTAEYATVTGCGVGFAAVRFKFLTSEMGQQLLRMIFTAIRSLLPF